MYLYTLIQSFEIFKEFFLTTSVSYGRNYIGYVINFPRFALGDLVTVVLIAVRVLRVTDMHYRYCIWFVAAERGAEFV